MIGIANHHCSVRCKTDNSIETRKGGTRTQFSLPASPLIVLPWSSHHCSHVVDQHKVGAKFCAPLLVDAIVWYTSYPSDVSPFGHTGFWPTFKIRDYRTIGESYNRCVIAYGTITKM